MPTLTIPASVAKRKQACRSCRQRKKKCDAERPACTLCRRLGTHCIYDSSSETAREERLMTYDARRAPSIQSATYVTVDHRSHALESYPTPEPSNISGNTSQHQDLFANIQLPAHDLLLELVELYFNNVGHLFPCFHRKSLEDQIHRRVVQDACPMLLFAICSMAARFYPDEAVRARQQAWYDQAKLNYELTQRNPYFPLRTIQAVIVLVSHGFTTGDFSAGCLCLGKVWKQIVTLGLNRMDAHQELEGSYVTSYSYGKHDGITAVEKEEMRRTLWMLFITDRNQAWPTGSPQAIAELHFKVDLPITNESFQAMDSSAEKGPTDNTPFTRNISRLIASLATVDGTINVYTYVCVAHILLGRVADLVHSLHASPGSAEYAEECEELDESLVKFRLSLPRQATSILEARLVDCGHVMWLQIILNTCAMLLHYRRSSAVPVGNASPQFIMAVTAARSIVQVVKDVSRISIDLLMSVHIASSLYIAACILVIEYRTTGDLSYKDDVDLLALVFDRMNKVFVFLGLKYKLALEHDLSRSKESVADLRNRGLRGLLADCSKWAHVKEEVERQRIPINIT